MRALADTHTFLWYIAGNERLGSEARAVISDSANQILFSAASLWEIAIKVSLGKLALDEPYDKLVPAQLELNSIDVLPIGFDHLATLISLPFHHRDPFDRLIAAQALSLSVPVLSTDGAFDAYGVLRIW